MSTTCPERPQAAGPQRPRCQRQPHTQRCKPAGFTLISVVFILVVLAALDIDLGAKAYPVLLSLAAACVFAQSLISPPSLIERMEQESCV